MLLYRGTQTASASRGVRGAQSYTDVLLVAAIWSAVPGDAWGRHPAVFLPTSTIHAVELQSSKTLDLRNLGNHATLWDVVKRLGYGKTFSDDDVLKVYNYMHNRIIGKARGGDFRYRVWNEDGEELEERDVPFSFTRPQTLISWEARESFDAAMRHDECVDAMNQIRADIFIFVDAPAVQRVAKQLGYAAVVYKDVFQGGESAAEELLGEDVEDIEGVDLEDDIDDEEVPTHDTYRILDESAVQPLWSRPTEEVLVDLGASEE